eukprot:6463376-Amphidinium_carterae.1
MAMLQANNVRMAVESSRVISKGRFASAYRGGLLPSGDIDVEDPLIVPDKREPPSEEPGASSGSGHAQKKLKMSNIID